MLSTVLELTKTRFMTNRSSKFACGKISALPRFDTFAMLFAFQPTRACIFDISADQNVWLRSALRSLRLYGNSLFCDRLRLFAICDLRSSAIIWKPAFNCKHFTETSEIKIRKPFLTKHFLVTVCVNLLECRQLLLLLGLISVRGRFLALAFSSFERTRGNHPATVKQTYTRTWINRAHSLVLNLFISVDFSLLSSRTGNRAGVFTWKDFHPAR